MKSTGALLKRFLIQYRLSLRAIEVTALFLFTLSSSSASASNYFSRFTVGSYISDENLAASADGTTRNSFATISSRAFFQVNDVDNSHYEVVGDLRDTHDFFDKLDAERLQLTAANRMQVKQLSVRAPRIGRDFFGSAGRFPVPESGAIIVDGALAGFRFDSANQVAAFGGLNPQRVDQTYAQWNTNSQNFGAYYRFQPQFDSWSDSLVGNTAVVTQMVQNHMDRLYWYGNYYHQWNTRNSLVAIGYLDFVPKFKVQTAYLSHGRVLSPSWYGSAALSAIDVIEYSRRKGVLERLAPSNYQEANLNFEQKNSEHFALKYNAVYGLRNADRLSRIEGSAGFALSNLGSKHLAFQALGAYRKNFTSTDEILRSNLSYTSREWEGDFDLEGGFRKKSTGVMNHPIVAEATYANYISKALYGTFSLQYARDEDVRIVSAFIKLGYRFGSDDVAPLRDGSPPAGGRL